MKIPARKDGIFVGIQLLLFIIYWIPTAFGSFAPNNAVKYGGLGVGIFGIAIIALAILQLNHNLTPFPTPKESGTLIQTGLYKVVRHPIYSGIILGAIGFGFYLGSGWKMVIGLGLWVLFYVKSSYEEKLLAAQYPDYESYQKRSGRFFPFL